MQWKFPYKNGEFGINARAETLSDRQAFRNPVQTSRGLVIVNGFYEWAKTKPKKQPYYFYNSKMCNIAGEEDIKIMFLACIFKKVGTENNFTIITVDADPSVSWIHHRMPAIIYDRESALKWIDPATDVNEATKLLKPYSQLSYHMVSTLVGNSKNESAECVVKIEKSEINDLKPNASKVTKVKNEKITNYFTVSKN